MSTSVCELCVGVCVYLCFFFYLRIPVVGMIITVVVIVIITVIAVIVVIVIVIAIAVGVICVSVGILIRDPLVHAQN